MDNNYFISEVNISPTQTIEVKRSVFYPYIPLVKAEDIKKVLAVSLARHDRQITDEYIQQFSNAINNTPIDDELSIVINAAEIIGKTNNLSFIYGFSDVEDENLIGNINMNYTEHNRVDVHQNGEKSLYPLSQAVSTLAASNFDATFKGSEQEIKERYYKGNPPQIKVSLTSGFLSSYSKFNLRYPSDKILKNFDIVSRNVLGAIAITNNEFEQSVKYICKNNRFSFSHTAFIDDKEEEFEGKNICSYHHGPLAVKFFDVDEEFEAELKEKDFKMNLGFSKRYEAADAFVHVNKDNGIQYLEMTNEQDKTIILKGTVGPFSSSTRSENVLIKEFCSGESYKESEYFALFAKTNNALTDLKSFSSIKNSLNELIKNIFSSLLNDNYNNFYFNKIKSHHEGELDYSFPETKEQEDKLVKAIASVIHEAETLSVELSSGFFIKLAHNKDVGTFWSPKTKSPAESFSWRMNEDSFMHGVSNSSTVKFNPELEHIKEYVKSQITEQIEFYKTMYSHIEEENEDITEEKAKKLLAHKINSMSGHELLEEIYDSKEEIDFSDWDIDGIDDENKAEESKPEEEELEELEEEEIEEIEEPALTNEQEPTLLDPEEIEIEQNNEPVTETPSDMNDNDDFNLDLSFEDLGFDSDNISQEENKESMPENTQPKEQKPELENDDDDDFMFDFDELFEEPKQLSEEPEEEEAVKENTPKKESEDEELTLAEKFKKRMEERQKKQAATKSNQEKKGKSFVELIKERKEKERVEEEAKEAKESSDNKPSQEIPFEVTNAPQETKKEATQEHVEPQPKTASPQQRTNQEEVKMPPSNDTSIAQILGIKNDSEAINMVELQKAISNLTGNENIEDITKLLNLLQQSIAMANGNMDFINYSAILNKVAAIALSLNKRIEKCS